MNFCKPGKLKDDAKSSTSTAECNVLYKLLERLLYVSTIGSKMQETVPIEQAGFRPERSCTDHIMALTNHIKTRI